MILEEHLKGLINEDPSNKPALVLQGGGMRGIYSIAALSVLEELDLTSAFSFAIGSSAGAINGAYFLAGQALEGITIYSDDLSNHDFINPWRPWRIVDVDFMVDEALKVRHPLDTARLGESRVPVQFILTQAETAQLEIISSDSEHDIYELIRATAALPALYNKRVRVGPKSYVDGGLVAPLPLHEAFAHGAKSALVITTRGKGYRRNDHGSLYRSAGRLLAYGQSQAVRAKIGMGDPSYNAAMQRLESESIHTPRNTWTVFPSDESLLAGRTGSERTHLLECAAMARDDMRALLSGPA